jgi:hypothetical protein
VQFGTKVIQDSLLFVFLIIALGVAIELISFSLRRNTTEQVVFFGEWSIRYSQLLKGLQYLALIFSFINYQIFPDCHFRLFPLKQAKVAQIAESVTGDTLDRTKCTPNTLHYRRTIHL